VAEQLAFHDGEGAVHSGQGEIRLPLRPGQRIGIKEHDGQAAGQRQQARDDGPGQQALAENRVAHVTADQLRGLGAARLHERKWWQLEAQPGRCLPSPVPKKIAQPRPLLGIGHVFGDGQQVAAHHGGQLDVEAAEVVGCRQVVTFQRPGILFTLRLEPEQVDSHAEQRLDSPGRGKGTQDLVL
jgi:hypothetical protein